MKRVELEQQVVEFIRSCAPDPRKHLRKALRDLAEERGDLRALEGPLDGYYRLRIGSYRIIFRYVVERRQVHIRCVFAERRALIYEVFERLLTESSTSRPKSGG